MTKLSEDRLFAENYFNFISELVPESTTNLKQFGKNEVPEPAEQRELLTKFDQTKGHQQSFAALGSLLQVSLDKCATFVRFGFNLLCYGYGSKRDLLESFVKKQMSDYNVFSLVAFSEEAINLGPIALFNSFLVAMHKNIAPMIKDKSLVKEVAEYFSATTASKNSIILRTEALCKLIKSAKLPVVCLIHQLDSSALRSPVVYDCLTRLTAEAGVALIASIDNPNIVNLISPDQFCQMNWIWTDCTTMQPYQEELNRFVLDACASSVAKQSPRAALIVLQSLTTNSRSIFKLLAAHQLSIPEAEVNSLLDSLEDEEDKEQVGASETYSGLSYHALFQKCQENFVVTAEANFRTQLTEFTDHDLFKSMEGRDGSLMFFIPFYHADLRQILQEV